MIGLVLCGGQSTRMGTDKGLLKTDAGSWAELAAAKLSALALPVYIAVNKLQYGCYATVFTADQLITDNNNIDVKGPLKGLLSAHLQHPAEDIFVLACDMPLMETAVLQDLLAFSKHHTADAYLYKNEGAFEPLCGIYTAGTLARAMQMLVSGQLARHSMKYVLEQVSTASINVLPNQLQYFRNFNAPAAFNGLQAVPKISGVQ